MSRTESNEPRRGGIPFRGQYVHRERRDELLEEAHEAEIEEALEEREGPDG